MYTQNTEEARLLAVKTYGTGEVEFVSISTPFRIKVELDDNSFDVIFHNGEEYDKNTEWLIAILVHTADECKNLSTVSEQVLQYLTEFVSECVSRDIAEFMNTGHVDAGSLGTISYFDLTKLRKKWGDELNTQLQCMNLVPRKTEYK